MAAWTANLSKDFERTEPYIPILLSVRPKVLRITHMFTPKECALLRWLMLEALIYFGDSSEMVTTRPGSVNSSSGFGNLGKRPLMRMQDPDQLSFYFQETKRFCGVGLGCQISIDVPQPEPPDFMIAMMQRVGTMVGVHPNNVEAIYHLYKPNAELANLHLDNFNKYLWPHRFMSASLFLDDYEDGGTVFPLFLDTISGDGDVGVSSVAQEHDEVRAWQRALNDARMHRVASDTEAYAHRRVDSGEPGEFRQRVLQAAKDMCRLGRPAQIPVLPAKGTMYLWFNYLDNGEDDVRTIHAGCSSSASYKMIGTMFLRDGSGPFREHDSFWNPTVKKVDKAEEVRRTIEATQASHFRFSHIAALFDLERQSVFELHGGAEAVRLARFQHLYTDVLIQQEADERLYSQYAGMVQQYPPDSQVRWAATAQDGHLF
ncbi:unnamed protein product [Symbiodinium sp. CCMP2592]|nr:unnamed protein product [Symbiodinium sp. CCMP2592]